MSDSMLEPLLKESLDMSSIPTLDVNSIPKIDIAALTAQISPLSTDQISALYNSNIMSGYPGGLHSYGLNSYGNVIVNSGSTTTNPHTSPYIYNNTTGPSYTTGMPAWTTISPSSGLHVKDDATFEGDIKWKGRSLGKLLAAIEDRLAILSEPDPEKLEKFASLKKAYDHYKTLERLIGDD
jgi:hypothetical protein